jgi:hypothetical protein
MKSLFLQLGRSIHEVKPLASRRGSALITTLLVTSLIMLIALGVAQLITGDLRTASEFVQDGKALYMAEAGLERGMLSLKGQLPGFKPKDLSVNVPAVNALGDEGLTYQVSFQTQSTDVPHVDPDAIGELNKLDAYLPLLQQHSVAIPLFTVKEDGTAVTVKNFLVKYFVPFKTKVVGLNIQDIDFFRWKIVGVNKDTNKAESIGDFTSVADYASAEKPNCFGTSIGEVADEAIDGGCIADSVKKVTDSQNCNYSEARSYYQYVKNPNFDNSVELLEAKCYAISAFLEHHKQSYLVLTNFVNQNIIQALNSDAQSALSRIYYRVVSTDPVLRDKVIVQSTGSAGGVLGLGGGAGLGAARQDLDIQIAGDAFLPVFNFSIYRTDGQSGKGG